VTSIVADYRASAGIDVVHDQADLDAGSQPAMPVTVVQQDWGAQLGYDAAAVWRAWATGTSLRHPADAGPTVAALLSLFALDSAAQANPDGPA
jgi:hypothetical protein